MTSLGKTKSKKSLKDLCSTVRQYAITALAKAVSRSRPGASRLVFESFSATELTNSENIAALAPGSQIAAPPRIDGSRAAIVDQQAEACRRLLDSRSAGPKLAKCPNIINAGNCPANLNDGWNPVLDLQPCLIAVVKGSTKPSESFPGPKTASNSSDVRRDASFTLSLVGRKFPG
jgi:hypothetical protein